MLQAFIIVLREGLESFLIVAVIAAYLKKTGRRDLLPAAYSGIAASVLLSAGLSFALAGVSDNSMVEGVLGAVTAVLVASLVIHMWRVGPSFKQSMEQKISKASHEGTKRAAVVSVFLVTVFLITREGMETALMLFQVKNGRFISGSLLGLGGAACVSYLWASYGHLINLRRFFQVTGIYLIFFMIQVGFTAFHELCEAGVFPKSDAWHAATEAYSPDGRYGKWFSFITIMALGVWLLTAAFIDRLKAKKALSSRKDSAAVPSVKTAQ